jgi:hypothetical protein
MGRRLLLLGLGFALALLLAYPGLGAETGGINLFYWLLGGLIACALVLWPSNARIQREELKQERIGWADRVPVNAPPAQADERPLALRSARSRARHQI